MSERSHGPQKGFKASSCAQEKATLADGEDRKGSGMVTLHQMAEATLGQAGASATSAVYLGVCCCYGIDTAHSSSVLRAAERWYAGMDSDSFAAFAWLWAALARSSRISSGAGSSWIQMLSSLLILLLCRS